MIVINLYGGPGAGKSTTRALLFAEMKKAGLNVEEVTEYAKDMVWEERSNIFTDQLYILAKQNRRLLRLVGKVDYVITDSPLMLNSIYLTDGPYSAKLDELITEVSDSYSNINIYLKRAHEYQPLGRNQTEEEAKDIDNQILDLLSKCKGNWWWFNTSEFNLEKLREIIAID